MDFSEVRTHLHEEYDFPVEHETLVAEVGHVELETRTAESETIRTVLARTDETTYRSVDDVYTSLLGTLGESYIGRKHYDDRNGALPIPRRGSPVSV